MTLNDCELSQLADKLYEYSDDDDVTLVQLMHDLDPEIAIQLCTSDLTNAAQVYIYAFNEIPDEYLYDLLLLYPASQIKSGIKIRSIEFVDLVMKYNSFNKLFFIEVYDDGKLVDKFHGDGAYDQAVSCAEEIVSLDSSTSGN